MNAPAALFLDRLLDGGQSGRTPCTIMRSAPRHDAAQIPIVIVQRDIGQVIRSQERTCSRSVGFCRIAARTSENCA
jgi:hypothetical protein